MSMADNRRKIAEYLEAHQGAHVRSVVSAMVEQKAMSWNTAYRTLERMEQEGSVTAIWQKKTVEYERFNNTSGVPRNKTVKTVWLTLGNDGATSDPEAKHTETEQKETSTESPLIQVGDEFGHWTVISAELKKVSAGQYKALCRCKCGTRKWVATKSLRMGVSRSCGCMKNEWRKETDSQEQETE